MKKNCAEVRAPNFKQLHEKDKKAEKQVDNNPPRLMVTLYVSKTKYHEQLQSAIDLKERNVKLIQDINTIYRTTGPTINSWDPKVVLPRLFKKETFNKEQRRKIKSENECRRKNLELIGSSYSEKNLNKKNSFQIKEFLKKKANRARSANDAWSICPHGFKSNYSKRKTCFLDIQVDDWAVGRLEIELYCDIVPITTQNFINICNSNSKITYAKTIFFRIVPGLFCLGGDVINNSGTGGSTVDGGSFPDENYILLHNGPGVISMYKREPKKNDSQFLITFKKLKSLDGKFVVFGRVKSMKILGIIEEFGTPCGKPKRRICVTKCGVVE